MSKLSNNVVLDLSILHYDMWLSVLYKPQNKQRNVILMTNILLTLIFYEMGCFILFYVCKAESINQALKEHFAEENVDFVCARCKNKTMAIKDTKLLTIPKNVVIQLKRFSSARRKINKRMQIQTEILLRNYTADEVELEDKCKLFGIIIHQGSSLSTGHCYCFLEFGGQ
ncbi:ubiquitin carboxyl-terminal hydrolase 17-like protein B [Mizuhopecten yessoensis]|uniref:ubiquitin carboxyl-terminal hydrolase 17-like protein B n=1 Tax=Mizuhopecten yessoensis TaxID=6573 RepID=UPI000B45AC5C|nr:ubiquitin carboxyl-terminal hydrolase 17-like protein B [Mizuhopecten yessoensis]